MKIKFVKIIKIRGNLKKLDYTLWWRKDEIDNFTLNGNVYGNVNGSDCLKNENDHRVHYHRHLHYVHLLVYLPPGVHVVHLARYRPIFQWHFSYPKLRQILQHYKKKECFNKQQHTGGALDVKFTLHYDVVCAHLHMLLHQLDAYNP